MTRNHMRRIVLDRNHTVAAVAALLMLVLLTAAGEAFAEPAERSAADSPDHAAAVQAVYQERLAESKDNPDVLVRPGLLANRKEQWVRLTAQATGIGPEEPVEFFLVGPGGKAYEAIATTFVKPSDVHTALEFIGVPLGRPVDYRRFHRDPKGERVHMTFTWEEPPGSAPGDQPRPQQVRAEQLLINTQTGEPLSPIGFVFVGRWREDPDRPAGERRYYPADGYAARSIASNYNEPATVLDVPRRAAQGDVYGSQKLNPDHRFKEGQLVEVLLEPEYADGTQRVVDLSLHIAPRPLRNAGTIQDLAFRLVDSQGQQLSQDASLPALLAEFGNLTESGRDPFVTVHPDDALPLATLRQIASLLEAVQRGGVRIEPPPEGHLYYEALLPHESWRDPAHRRWDSWELHLKVPHERLEATLVELPPRFGNSEQTEPAVFRVDGPESLAERIEQRRGRHQRELFVFVPADLHYGELRGLLRQVLLSSPTLYVFLDRKTGGADEAAGP